MFTYAEMNPSLEGNAPGFKTAAPNELCVNTPKDTRVFILNMIHAPKKLDPTLSILQLSC